MEISIRGYRVMLTGLGYTNGSICELESEALKRLLQ